MILFTEHATERYGNWYLGPPGHYAIFNDKGQFTGDWCYSLP